VVATTNELVFELEGALGFLRVAVGHELREFLEFGVLSFFKAGEEVSEKTGFLSDFLDLRE
jgi:hypothetical protein